MTATEFFPYTNSRGQTYPVKWLAKSPIHRGAYCDRCSTWVLANERRLCVDNGAGPIRKRGKGKRHQYICQGCAINVPDDGGQVELF